MLGPQDGLLLRRDGDGDLDRRTGAGGNDLRKRAMPLCGAFLDCSRLLREAGGAKGGARAGAAWRLLAGRRTCADAMLAQTTCSYR